MNGTVRLKLWLVGVVTAAALIATACGGQGLETGDSGTTPAAPGQPAVADGPPTAQTVDVSNFPEAPAITGDVPAAPAAAILIPETVVAAQELVLTGVYETVLPSVVHILTAVDAESAGDGSFGYRFDSPFGDSESLPEQFFRQGEGTGFVWDEQGHIVTNHHVVADADRVTVEFADGTELVAELLGSDPDSDLAVLRIDPPAGGLTPVILGDSAGLKVGQMAVAIGNPFGQDFTMTSGIVSALGRTRPSGLTNYSIPLVIQHDAAINPGSSGGPLLDRLGRVIGINTQIISESGTSAGIGFAVPVNVAAKVVPALISDGEYRHAWLGISGVDLFPELREAAGLPADVRGVLVQTVIADGPAGEAGVVAGGQQLRLAGRSYAIGGDTIVAIDGTPVREMGDLINFLAEFGVPGDTATLEVVRGDGERVDLEVTLGSRPRT